MSLVVAREALDPGELPSGDALAAHARRTRSKSVLLAGALLGLAGATIAALRGVGSVWAVGAVAMVLVLLAAWLVVAVMGDLVVLRMMREERAALDAVRSGGVVEVLRLDPDAAWRAHPLDDDAPALLLRCGERFLYLNEPLDELVDEDDAPRAEPDGAPGPQPTSQPTSPPTGHTTGHTTGHPTPNSAPAPPRVRQIVQVRRLPAPDGRVLEVLAGAGWLALGDLPSIADADPQLAAIAARAEWSCAVLTWDQLPHAWNEAVRAR